MRREPPPDGLAGPATPPAAAVAYAPARRLREGRIAEEPDALAVEAPLEIRLGELSTVLLRTPGDDPDLVRGFLLTEGFVRDVADVVAIDDAGGPAPPQAGSVVAVTLSTPPPRLTGARLLVASSGCGACGKGSLDALAVRAPAVTSPLQVTAALVARLPDRLREAQTGFAATGGLHAAGLFAADGTLLAAREDIGRHNAVDKVVGWALAAGVALETAILVVSGRLGYEIAAKAIVAAIPIVVSVGAASSLAVELAQAHGVALVTFTRPSSLNVFGRTGRVLGTLPAQ